MGEAQDAIDKSVGPLKMPKIASKMTPEQEKSKEIPTKEPWQVTKEEFGKAFYIHGRPENHAEQIRKTGLIMDGSFLRVIDPRDIQIALNFATQNGTEPGVIFVARAESFRDIDLIKKWYKDGDYPQTIEASEHEGIPIPYIAEVPAAPDVDPHKYLVENALRETQAVPPEVLADYPDLQAKSKSYQSKSPKRFFPKLFR